MIHFYRYLHGKQKRRFEIPLKSTVERFQRDNSGEDQRTENYNGNGLSQKNVDLVCAKISYSRRLKQSI